MSDSNSKTPNRAGIVLKQAREAQGISLDTVHAATKIPMDVLKSIEEGYKVRTLTPFYVKGFMKMYAHYLGVDVSKVVDDYHIEQLPEPIKATPKNIIQVEEIAFRFPKETQRKVAIFVGVLFALFIGMKILAVAKVLPVAQKTKAQRPVAAGAAKAASRTAADSSKNDLSVKQKEEQKTVQPTAKSAPAVKRAAGKDASVKSKKEKAAVVAAPPVPEAVASSSEEEDKQKAAAKKVRLTVRAVKSGWLQVKVDGNLVFQATLEAGSSETWTAEKIIELSGKSIHNLEYEVNGKTLGALGREDRSARRVVVTPEGLAVKSSL